MWQTLFGAFDSQSTEKQMSGEEAIAAILVRAAKTDNEYTKSEKKLIESFLIKRNFSTANDAFELRIRGEELEQKINDNVQITRIIKDNVPYEERTSLVEQLWEIILNDDIRTPEENKLMRVISHLLGVTDVQSAEARLKVLRG